MNTTYLTHVYKSNQGILPSNKRNHVKEMFLEIF